MVERPSYGRAAELAAVAAGPAAAAPADLLLLHCQGVARAVAAGAPSLLQMAVRLLVAGQAEGGAHRGGAQGGAAGLPMQPPRLLLPPAAGPAEVAALQGAARAAAAGPLQAIHQHHDNHT